MREQYEKAEASVLIGSARKASQLENLLSRLEFAADKLADHNGVAMKEIIRLRGNWPEPCGSACEQEGNPECVLGRLQIVIADLEKRVEQTGRNANNLCDI